MKFLDVGCCCWFRFVGMVLKRSFVVDRFAGGVCGREELREACGVWRERV